MFIIYYLFFFFQAEDGIRDGTVTGVQTCALPICLRRLDCRAPTPRRNGDLRTGRTPSSRKFRYRPCTATAAIIPLAMTSAYPPPGRCGVVSCNYALTCSKSVPNRLGSVHQSKQAT